MKCAICKNKTNWGESCGYNEFIVCPKCFEKLDSHKTALSFIFAAGRIRKEEKEKNKNG